LSEANESIEIVVEAGFSISPGYEEILQKIRDRKNPLVKTRLISTLTPKLNFKQKDNLGGYLMDC
jgi:hypothetical protein